MRKVVRSRGYARIRAIFGLLFIALGAVIAMRSFTLVGLVPQAIPSYILAVMLAALGAWRIREFLISRGTPP